VSVIECGTRWTLSNRKHRRAEPGGRCRVVGGTILEIKKWRRFEMAPKTRQFRKEQRKRKRRVEDTTTPSAKKWKQQQRNGLVYGRQLFIQTRRELVSYVEKSLYLAFLHRDISVVSLYIRGINGLQRAVKVAKQRAALDVDKGIRNVLLKSTQLPRYSPIPNLVVAFLASGFLVPSLSFDECSDYYDIKGQERMYSFSKRPRACLGKCSTHVITPFVSSKGLHCGRCIGVSYCCVSRRFLVGQQTFSMDEGATGGWATWVD